MDSAHFYDAVVVGGGLAGTTVAAELASLAPRDFRLLLVEARDPGPGSAYAPGSEKLYMNGTAISMSAVPGDKRHLVRWLRNEPDEAQIPRYLFGRYLRERFYEAVANRPDFHVARAEVVDVLPQDGGFVAVDDLGCRYRARNVVLALGNFPPDDSFLPEALRRHEGYVADPWRFDPSAMQGDALAIGSGLTAMDVVALLAASDWQGRVHVVSRHGLLPCTDNPFASELDARTLELRTETPYALMRTLRAQARKHVARGGDWRDVIEAIRTMSPAVWTSWSLPERRRFLRHLQPFWAIHRYRVPPPTAQAFERLAQEGRVVRHRGRVVSARRTEDGAVAVEIAGARGNSEIVVNAAINCTGPNGNYERVRHPLVRNLIARGVLRPDPLKLGLDATAELRVVDRQGHPNERLFALGPPLRGLFYETTAVPETREQAATIARSLLAERAARRLRPVS
ncbi:MAG: FAD/NAD(P)-binding protein [Candidatus Eremiobacteraeota bacterium]|nr:FAD/NAD(P)-binding protein [Candidatus Eremiobacteraeota bacterium]